MATKTLRKPTIISTNGTSTPNGTQTGAPPSDTKGVGTGSTVKGIGTATWAVALLEQMEKDGYKAPITATNIANIQRVIGAESGGNTAGFLRDNNPWNLNTYTAPHSSLPGGTIVQEFGINVQTFPSVEQGVAATAKQIEQSGALSSAIATSAPASVFGAALNQSAWKGQSYANSTKFPTLTPYTGISAVGGQGLTFSPSKGAAAVENAGKEVGNVVTKPISGLVKLESELTSATFWKRIGVGALGVGLVITGIILFTVTSKTGEKTIDTATKAV
jgi:hypothetical protein